MTVKTCIVMATYKGAPYLEKQFESLFAQTCPPDAIVVRDDNSPDNSLDLLEAIAARAPVPVTVIAGDENLGFKANFATALSKARADIYFLCDQDDWWLPQKIERHLDIYARDPRLLTVISDQEIAGPNLERSGRTSLEEIRRLRTGDTDFVHGCCTSFRHALFPLACAPQADVGHDDWVHILAGFCGRRFVLEEPLQLFRRHGGTTTRSDFNAFEQAPSRRGRSGAAAVAGNLRRRQAIAEAACKALETATGIAESDRRRGASNARKAAVRAAARADILERGVAGIVPMLWRGATGREHPGIVARDAYRLLTGRGA